MGFHVPHEIACTNYLEAMDLAGIPFYSTDRGEDDPLVIAGGPSVYNPEPLAPFFDAILIGEGEEHIVEFCRAHQRLRDEGVPRMEMLRELAKIPGTYVPVLYEVSHEGPAPRTATRSRRRARPFPRSCTSAWSRTLARPTP